MDPVLSGRLWVFPLRDTGVGPLGSPGAHPAGLLSARFQGPIEVPPRLYFPGQEKDGELNAVSHKFVSCTKQYAHLL